MGCIIRSPPPSSPNSNFVYLPNTPCYLCLTQQNLRLVINSQRQTERTIAILYLLATATSVAGLFLLQPSLTSPDYLNYLYSNRLSLSLAVVFQLSYDIYVVFIGILLYKILRLRSLTIAMAILSTRLMEATILALGNIGLLLLDPISKEYGVGENQDAPYLKSLGSMVQHWTNWSFDMAMLSLGIGGTVFCFFLFKRRWIPRPLAVLGVIGYVSLFSSSMMGMFYYSNARFLFLFVALFELIFSIWLLVKGFKDHAALSYA